MHLKLTYFCYSMRTFKWLLFCSSGYN